MVAVPPKARALAAARAERERRRTAEAVLFTARVLGERVDVLLQLRPSTLPILFAEAIDQALGQAIAEAGPDAEAWN